MNKALFVTYGGGHVTMIVPVLQELQRRGGWDPWVLGLTTARPVLERSGIPYLGFKDLLVPEDRAALACGAELARTNHREGVGVPLEESIAYLGLCYADLESRVGPEAAAKQYRQGGRAAFLPLGPVERLVRRVNPSIIVATNSPRSEAAAIRTARRLGIPSLCLVDSFVPDLILTDGLSPFLIEPGYADRVAVLSEAVRSRFVELGRPPAEVVVTGNPAYDRLSELSIGVRAAEWRRERGLQGKKVILWAGHPEPDDPGLPERIFQEIVSALPSHPDWHLIHRPHPSETFPPGDPPPRTGRSASSEDVATVLAAADVVVTLTSTVGMQAALMDKPLVKVCLSAWDSQVPYEKMGLARGVARLEELATALEQALSDGPEARALAAARRSLPRVGQATSRVADLMESLVRR